MVSTDQLPALVFVLTVYLALTVALFIALYWVVRLAVRHAAEDTDRRRANQQR
ncbi:hypothetical protein [Plantactinospora endophytica]|uniref:Heme exporter protein D n=1 Tax=Plantactinospora endophytica TaxID=673535 RepID=A0ABQ4E5X4_9ACTN|nr:hypothetical protein [Plantactinospora endophytica]GIG89717.1 hypothetical protein Pen02_46530 [Plantactinospora endophytica]